MKKSPDVAVINQKHEGQIPLVGDRPLPFNRPWETAGGPQETTGNHASNIHRGRWETFDSWIDNIDSWIDNINSWIDTI